MIASLSSASSSGFSVLPGNYSLLARLLSNDWRLRYKGEDVALAQRFSELNLIECLVTREPHGFKVDDTASKTAYSIEFIYDETRGLLLGKCECEAKVNCLHAAMVCVEAERRADSKKAPRRYPYEHRQTPPPTDRVLYANFMRDTTHQLAPTVIHLLSDRWKLPGLALHIREKVAALKDPARLALVDRVLEWGDGGRVGSLDHFRELVQSGVIGHGRHYEEESPWLTWAEPCNLEFYWYESSASDGMRCALRAAGRLEARLFYCDDEAIGYIDIDRKEVGMIRTPYPFHLIWRMVAKTYDEAGLLQLSAIVSQEYPEHMEVLPRSAEPESVGGIPVPILRLHFDAGMVRAGILRMDYDGRVICDPAYPEVTLHEVDGALLEVNRNLRFEEAAELRLSGHFTREERGELVPSSPIKMDGLLPFVERLRTEGWRVDGVPTVIDIAADSVEASMQSTDRGWTMRLEHGGQDMVPAIQRVLQEMDAKGIPLDQLNQHGGELHLPLSEGVFGKVKLEEFQAILDLIQGSIWSAGGRRADQVHPLEAIQVIRGTPALRWNCSELLRDAIQVLSRGGGIQPVSEIPSLKTTLKPHQEIGVGWLSLLDEASVGAILADDMGVGKTIQTLGLLCHRPAIEPTLVVAPAGACENWVREIETLAPHLKVVSAFGSKWRENLKAARTASVVITTYGYVAEYRELFCALSFDRVVIDEAHRIKNPRTLAYRAAVKLKSRVRYVLTGTPIENRLEDLWSLFNFVNPGYLGSEKEFKALFAKPISKGDDNRRALLQRKVTPFILRRLLADVEMDLPKKRESARMVAFGAAQARFYDLLRASSQKELRDVIAQRGLGKSQIHILTALTRLRQACCDPRLVKGVRTKAPSAKMEELKSMLSEMVPDGRRILVFSQFTEMLDLIEEDCLASLRIPFVRLDGGTRVRMPVIDLFQRGRVPVFLLSLKAGGVALNLTAADTVVHYDPWWNPAVEDQATGRAHRIGQKKSVEAIRLIAQGTLEEKILSMHASKRSLANSILAGTGSKELSFTKEEVDWLLAPIA